MRQRIWLVLVKNYDCSIKYHPGKANVVANALCKKSIERKGRNQNLFPELGIYMKMNTIEILLNEEVKQLMVMIDSPILLLSNIHSEWGTGTRAKLSEILH